MKMWRQGDLLIQEAKVIPEHSKKQKSLVLLASDISGHAHQIEKRKTCRIYQHNDEWFLDVFADNAALVHPEHSEIQLETGFYRVWRQREFSVSGGARYVLD